MYQEHMLDRRVMMRVAGTESRNHGDATSWRSAVETIFCLLILFILSLFHYSSSHTKGDLR
jgi:hypothetical protein